jgi:hypothetical protein
MNITRRRLFQTTAASGLAVLGGVGLGRGAAQSKSAGAKRVLAILGDRAHSVAPLESGLVERLRSAGYAALTVADYSVPWDDFGKYDLIIMSREAHGYALNYKGPGVNPITTRQGLWLTPEQDQKFEDYVNAGGRLFLYHDGFGYYLKGGGVSRAAKAFFFRHPAIVSINVSPTGKMPELTQGITPFTVSDEEYEVEMDESQTTVFMESHSPEHGRFAQGWAHPYGKGKVAVFIPGHSAPTISHPMVQRCIQNIEDWLLK